MGVSSCEDCSTVSTSGINQSLTPRHEPFSIKPKIYDTRSFGTRQNSFLEVTLKSDVS